MNEKIEVIVTRPATQRIALLNPSEVMRNRVMVGYTTPAMLAPQATTPTARALRLGNQVAATVFVSGVYNKGKVSTDLAS